MTLLKEKQSNETAAQITHLSLSVLVIKFCGLGMWLELVESSLVCVNLSAPSSAPNKTGCVYGGGRIRSSGLALTA